VVIIAITIPEIPRVVRLVRAVVLSVREQVYIQAAQRHRHALPAVDVEAHPAQHLAPLMVQATLSRPRRCWRRPI
jgi:peptide/nickel transport system permease protein